MRHLLNNPIVGQIALVFLFFKLTKSIKSVQTELNLILLAEI